MITFFRKIRKNLLGESNLGRYLTYAIGEIILVVIGILIALSIDNWNDKRNQISEFRETIDALEIDLNKNIEIANSFLKYAYSKDSLITMALDQRFTREMYQRNITARNMVRGYREINLIMDNVNSALNYEIKIPKDYTTIVAYLKDLKRQFNEVEFYNNVARDNTLKYLDWLAERYTWFGKNDSASIEKDIDYLLTDPLYSNRLKMYSMYFLSNYAYNVIYHRNLSVAILAEIQRYKYKMNNAEIKDFIVSAGLTPLKDINSNTLQENKISSIQFRINNLIINTTSQKVMVTVYSLFSENYNEYTIEPMGINLLQVFDGYTIEVVKENNEKQEVQAVADGFLYIKQDKTKAITE